MLVAGVGAGVLILVGYQPGFQWWQAAVGGVLISVYGSMCREDGRREVSA